MNHRRSRFLALTAALPTAARAQGAAEPPIRLGTSPNDSAAEAYYAQELGLFKKAGLNVELQTLTNGATIAQAVAGGALDVGGHNVVGLATAIAHSIPFAMIAAGGIYSTAAPTTAMATAKNAALRGAKDLEGKTVGVPSLRDLTYAAAVAWLQQNGADLAKIKFVEIPFPEAGAALERGTVAAAMIAEPSLSIALRGPARLFAKAFDAIAKQFMITCTFANTEWIRRNPEPARKLAQVWYDTARWANGNRQQSGEILARVVKLDLQTVQQMTRSTYAQSADPKLIQPALDAAYRYKFIDRAMSAGELLPR
jgi:NitT/TauT family transport system substrate-binding protein